MQRGGEEIANEVEEVIATTWIESGPSAAEEDDDEG